MILRGQRFELDFDSESDDNLAPSDPNLSRKHRDEDTRTTEQNPNPLPGAIVRDIIERSPQDASSRIPQPPQIRGHARGFPPPKSRQSKAATWQGAQSRVNQDAREPDQTGHVPHAKSNVQTKNTKTDRYNPNVQSSLSKASELNQTPLHNKSDCNSHGAEDNCQSIDRENRRRLESMTDAEIVQAQEEVRKSLSSSLLERLMKKSRIVNERDVERREESFDSPASSQAIEISENATPASTSKASISCTNVSQGISDGICIQDTDRQSHSPLSPEAPNVAIFEIEAAPLNPPADLYPAASRTPLPPAELKRVTRGTKSQFCHNDGENDLSNKSELHPFDDPLTTQNDMNSPDDRTLRFPQPPAPDLDPTSPDFLKNLHSIYFPSLPTDPSKLAWMQNAKQSDTSAALDLHDGKALSNGQQQAFSDEYSWQDESLPISSLRFSFRGHLLPPRLAAQIPITKGLHHHGHAPHAAGYTIPELALLSRSSVASQRCIAFQTLGRILYRLGRGDFGKENPVRQKSTGKESRAMDIDSTQGDGAVGKVDDDEIDDDAGRILCAGLWELIEKERVLELLIDAARDREVASRDDRTPTHVNSDSSTAVQDSHSKSSSDHEDLEDLRRDPASKPVYQPIARPPWNQTVWAMATDAVWLWRKGGGRQFASR